MNSTNIITSLNVNTQLPLDYKTYVYNENSLLDLGLNQTKAFSYYVGMKVYCVLQNKTYIWREYVTPLELNGLIPNGFIYPNGILNTDYNYSNKKFNFFIYEINELNNKVDKVIDKSLISNSEIIRLLTLNNFDNSANIAAFELKSNKIIEQVHVTTSMEVNPLWNGKIIIIRNPSVVLTVPAMLPNNFTFDAIIRPGANCNFAITAPKIWVNGTPSGLGAKTTFVFIQDSLNSNEIYLIT